MYKKDAFSNFPRLGYVNPYRVSCRGRWCAVLPHFLNSQSARQPVISVSKSAMMMMMIQYVYVYVYVYGEGFRILLEYQR